MYKWVFCEYGELWRSQSQISCKWFSGSKSRFVSHIFIHQVSHINTQRTKLPYKAKHHRLLVLHSIYAKNKYFAGSRATAFSLPFVWRWYSRSRFKGGFFKFSQQYRDNCLVRNTLTGYSLVGNLNPVLLDDFCYFSPLPFYYLPPGAPFPLLRQGGPILWHITQPHTRTQKRWPASCWRGETVFTVTPFWRGRLIPL